MVHQQVPERERGTGLHETRAFACCENDHSAICMEGELKSPTRSYALVARAANSFSLRWVAAAKAHAVLARDCSSKSTIHLSTTFVIAKNSFLSERPTVEKDHAMLAKF
eukprot:gnl/TRDRNA2_/TRDRNA2_139678_c1_seq1.p1 gnl/TRDRNA2_/TRDRNA2_139678_c1~~gnl/TRDRNA2_/TRDRNA2_139678_c1_seq1.p1  ORF type:complete len:109 (-),score=8.10 gnl/TRDRNA2_/TRDRNA2_139678_c1_seq1:198-524(-)